MVYDFKFGVDVVDNPSHGVDFALDRFFFFLLFSNTPQKNLLTNRKVIKMPQGAR